LNQKYSLIKNEPLRFIISFIVLFPLFYYFNIFFFGVTSPGNHYSAFLADHFDYIRGLRWLLLKSSAQILNWLGFSAITNEYELLVAGHGVIKLVYSCLGLGVISFFAAFVISYPKKWKAKIKFLISGILGIELLNVVRFVLLALFWNKHNTAIVDHHTIFNIFIYLIITISLYFWVKHDSALNKKNAAN
jgi:exosortase/archaeosortase family protein